VWKRMVAWLRRVRVHHKAKSAQKKLRTDKVTIVSQNCIGGVFYHDMGLQFQSPTVNIFFTASDFVKIASNPRKYLTKKIQVFDGEEWPIGIIDDVTIQFMHYHSCEEAQETWIRRVDRVDFDKIVIIATDRDGFDDTVFAEWKKITYPKVLFTANSAYADEPGSVFFKQYQKDGCVGDLITDRKFYKNDVLMNTVNQC